MFQSLKLTTAATNFIAVVAAVNAVLYHGPLFSFVSRELGVTSMSGAVMLAMLLVALMATTTVLLALLGLVSQRLLKPFCMFAAIGNSIAVYFIATYGAVLDKTMMGNVLNTNAAEAFELFDFSLIGYVFSLGVVPCVLLTRVTIRKSPRTHLAIAAVGALLFMGTFACFASSTWLWIDRNAKRVGGMALPWSYLINTARYVVPTLKVTEPDEPLPTGSVEADGTMIVVLVIGEAARP